MSASRALADRGRNSVTCKHELAFECSQLCCREKHTQRLWHSVLSRTQRIAHSRTHAHTHARAFTLLAMPPASLSQASPQDRLVWIGGRGRDGQVMRSAGGALALFDGGQSRPVSPLRVLLCMWALGAVALCAQRCACLPFFAHSHPHTRLARLCASNPNPTCSSSYCPIAYVCLGDYG